MLPVGGVLMAVFVGWLMRESSVTDEMAMRNQNYYKLWRILLRYVTPVGVFIVFLHITGVLEIFHQHSGN